METELNCNCRLRKARWNSRHSAPVGLLALLALAVLSSSTAYGQSGTVTEATCSQIDECPNPNLCEYTVSGTATGVGNNYTITLQNLDAGGNPILPLQVITVTDGNGNWSKTFDAPCGAVSVRVTGTDDPGRGGATFMDETVANACAGCPVPTVSEWSLIIMTVLAFTVGTVLFGRRRRAAAA